MSAAIHDVIEPPEMGDADTDRAMYRAALSVARAELSRLDAAMNPGRSTAITAAMRVRRTCGISSIA